MAAQGRAEHSTDDKGIVKLLVGLPLTQKRLTNKTGLEISLKLVCQSGCMFSLTF